MTVRCRYKISQLSFQKIIYQNKNYDIRQGNHPGYQARGKQTAKMNGTYC